MAAEEVIFTRLSTHTPITDLVGSSPVRIYPQEAGQSRPKPYLAYRRVSTQSQQSHDGDSGLEGVRMQITAWDNSPAAAKTLADLVKARLAGFRGTLGGDRVDGILVLDRAAVEERGRPGDATVYGFRQEFRVWVG